MLFRSLGGRRAGEELDRAVAAAFCADALAADTLRLIGRTDLAGYEGDFDHFGVDIKGNRLFLAGEDGGTLEVFNLRSGAHVRSVKGMETPHAIHYEPKRDRLIVSNSGDSLSKISEARATPSTRSGAPAPT